MPLLQVTPEEEERRIVVTSFRGRVRLLVLLFTGGTV